MKVPDVFAAALGLSPDAFQFLRQSQNTVFAFRDVAGNPRILRLTDGLHRTLTELEEELDWVRHLHEAGLSVCPPIPFPDGSWILSVSDDGGGGVRHGCVFVHARGRALEKEDIGPELDRLHGQHLGALHASARADLPVRLSRRKPWAAERYFTTDIDFYIPAQHRGGLREVFRELKEELDARVRAGEEGPVHLDLGYSNLCRDEDGLELFDFDNCARGPVVMDIAAALYGTIFTRLRCEFPGDRSVYEHPKAGENLARTWEHFAEGYRSVVGSLDMDREALGMALELMYFRSVVHACRLQHGSDDPKVRELLEVDLRNIIARTPPLRMDFMKLE